MFKHSATGGIGGLFAKTFHFFNYKREEAGSLGSAKLSGGESG